MNHAALLRQTIDLIPLMFSNLAVQVERDNSLTVPQVNELKNLVISAQATAKRMDRVLTKTLAIPGQNHQYGINRAKQRKERKPKPTADQLLAAAISQIGAERQAKADLTRETPRPGTPFPGTPTGSPSTDPDEVAQYSRETLVNLNPAETERLLSEL